MQSERATPCIWTDTGVGSCSACGAERRLYAPEHEPDARLCQPCTVQWTTREFWP